MHILYVILLLVMSQNCFGCSQDVVDRSQGTWIKSVKVEPLPTDFDTAEICIPSHVVNCRKDGGLFTLATPIDLKASGFNYQLRSDASTNDSTSSDSLNIIVNFGGRNPAAISCLDIFNSQLSRPESGVFMLNIGFDQYDESQPWPLSLKLEKMNQ